MIFRISLMGIMFAHVVIFASFDDVQRGYALLGSSVKKMPKKIEGSDSVVTIDKTIWQLQIPSYWSKTGKLVQDRDRWKISVENKADYDKVADIVASRITQETEFPITINWMDNRIEVARRGLQWLSIEEKRQKDQQAAYALLSCTAKIAYNCCGGHLPDPYAQHDVTPVKTRKFVVIRSDDCKDYDADDERT